MQNKEISTRRSKLSPAKLALLEKRLQVESVGQNKAPLIPRRAEHETVPLSFGQQRLWFLEQLEPGSSFYHITGAIRLTGKLNLKVLEQSLSEIQRRHEILRTKFRQTNEQPVQVVDPPTPVSLPIADLTGLEKGERQAEAQQLANTEALKTFDLSEGPVMRSRLLRLDDDEHVVLLTMHHIVSDGWSMGVLIKEMTALYEAYSKGMPSPLRELAIQYGDYSVWQRQWLQGTALDAELSYWKQQLSGAPPVLDLPADRPRPAVQTSRGENEVISLSSELTGRLKTLSSSEDVTLFMMLLAAFNTVLYRYTGQEDILIGTSIANRNRTLIEDMIGFFINTLVLRTRLSSDLSFRDLLKQVRRVVVDASAHQDLPFEMVVDSLQPERSLSHAPLFQVIFELQTAGLETLKLGGLKLSSLVPEKKASQFDISLWLIERDGELIGTLNYSADLFDAATIRRLLTHYEMLLRSIVSDLDQQILALPLLTEAERRQLIQEWNNTDKDYRLDRCTHELFQQQTEQTPDAVAVVFNDEQLSYRQLNSRANRLAWALAGRGIGPDVVVGLLADRSVDFLTAILAVFKAGGAYLPLDPVHPAERHSVILSQSSVPMILTTNRFMPRISETVNLLPSEKRPLICDLDDLLQGGKAEDNLPSHSNPDNLAYVIYTSGSTGLPKGVMIQHRGMLNHLHIKIDELGLTGDDVVAQTASQCFDISVWQFLAVLLAGGCVHIFEDEIAYDSTKLLKQVEREGVSILETVPSLLRATLESIEDDGLAHLQLRALRWLIPTGEALPPDLCRRWLARYPDIPLLNAYGPSECSDDVTHYPIVRPPLDGVANIPIGYALANMRLYILDGLLQPVPVGVAAELYVGGVGVGRGYLKDANRTSEAFLPDPFSEQYGARLYKTGDVARRLSDGNIQFLGRVDHQVKVRGFRIELGEIEVLLRRHPAVWDAIVLARENVSGDTRLVAYVVPDLHYDQQTDTSASRPALESERVVDWKMIFDDVYRQETVSDRDSSLHLRVWMNSYTGQPFAEEEIFECVEDSVSRILSLQPRRVLEIGCGTGLLLFRIAPRCEAYCGTDVSPEALRLLQQRLDLEKQLPAELSLLPRRAEDYGGIDRESFDVVVLNEVVQYFPNADYLLKVLEGAIEVVRSGGYIFVGGLRNLLLLEAFHASVNLFQSPASMKVEELRQRARAQAANEKELAVAPEFFEALQIRYPQLTRLWLIPKGGRSLNEFTKFRYDAILEVRGERVAADACAWVDWQDDQMTGESLSQLLRANSADLLGLAGIPNARSQSDVKAVDLLTGEREYETAGQIKEFLAEYREQSGGLDPEELEGVASEQGYEVSFSWASTDETGCYDAVFRKKSKGEAARPWCRKPGWAISPQTWSRYTNSPQPHREIVNLSPALRRDLKKSLPEYMIPTEFVMLGSFPLTSNGKVDRKALPAPEQGIPTQQAAASTARMSAVEEVVAGIWGEVLRADAITREDNFFEKGGHSLLAMRVMSRVRSAFNIDLPLRVLFDSPTLTEFSNRIRLVMSESSAACLPKMRRADRSRPLPLSFAQQRLWFLDQLEPANPFYNISSGVRLTGELNLSALEQTISDVVRRNEVLRTRFEVVEGEAAQVVMRAEPVRLTILDLSQIGEFQKREQAKLLASEEASRGFDLSQGPMMRVVVVRVSETQHDVLVTMHHIVSDEWSTDVLVREVRQLYEAFSKGEQSPLEELDLQYADYAVWQRELMKGEEYERQMSYWEEKLAGAPGLLEMPTDRARPAVQSYRGGIESLEVSEEVSEAIRRMSRREDVTMFMMMLGVMNVLLYRYSGETDLVVGSPVANRGRKGIEGLIGFFVNTLALRSRLSGKESFREVLMRVRETALEGYMNQEVPFEKVVERLQPERSLSHSPLFQVMLVQQNGREDRLVLGGADLQPVAAEATTAKFDLTLFVTDTGREIVTALEYNTDLYDVETARRMLLHLRALMGAVTADAARPVSRLEMMSEQERKQVLVDWNMTDFARAGAETVHEIFEQETLRRPDSVAMVMRQEEVTYRELNRRANQLAHYLRGVGVGPESLVGLCVNRGIEMIVGMLGILKAGAGYVPMDVSYPERRLTYMVEDSLAQAVVTRKEVEERLAGVSARLVVVDDPEQQEQISRQREDDTRSGARGENPAYVIYTSGSTGNPKGIILGHGALVNLFEWHSRELIRGARVLQFASISFDASIHEMFGGWATGGTVIVAGEEERADVERLCEYLVEQEVEKAVLPVVVLQEMAEVYAGREEELGALKEVITTGEQLQVTRGVKQMFERMRSSELHNHYGPSESHVVTAYQMKGEPEQWPWQPPIGKPISNTQMYILDDEEDAVPLAVVGELYLSGAGLARGYMNQPELTAEKFLPDLYSKDPGGRMYRTGDLSRYIAGGEIEYLGRRDQQVKIRGYRIELGEIEAELSKHEGVKESVVEVREAEGRGKQLVAYVVSEGGWRGKAGELRSYLRERMPDYMVPTAYVMLEALPLTTNGKVDRRALRAIEESRREEPGSGTEGKLTPVEEVVAGIWSEVLRVERITGENNFFELGGHSLLATRVISRVRSALNVEAPLRALFEAPTLSAFAERIEVARRSAQQLEAPPIVPVAREGHPPLSFAQERLWFLDRLEPGNPFYNIAAAVRLDGSLDVSAFEQSVAEIARRHEILRTTFASIDGSVVQVIAPEVNVDLAVIELTELPVSEREIEAKRLVAEEARRPIDLTRGPLLRVRLVKTGEQQMLLLFTIHHIIADGWSMEVLTNEFSVLYEAYSHHKESPLPELAIQYADYAIWQRAWLRGEALEQNLSYWTQQLDSTSVLELPTDRPRPAIQTYDGATHKLLIRSSVLDNLSHFNRQHSVTLFMTLIAAFKVLLYRYTAQEDICVGTPIANRNRKEIEGLIGFFVNTLVLRSKLEAGMSFRELLRREREIALSAYDHQDMPFEKLVEELQPERGLNRDPLFQVMFTLLKTDAELIESGDQSEGADDERGTSKYDVTLSIEEASNGLRASLEYRTALFDAATIKRMAGHFQTLLDGILAAPEQRIDTLPLLSQAERQQLLVEWNNTFTDYPRSSCIHHLFQSHASIRPDSIALMFDDQSLSYHHLNASANQLAHYLIGKGAGPESVVGICVERSVEMVVGLLAILKSGAAYLPLDPAYPSQRLHYMIRDAGATTVLTQQSVAAALDDAAAEVVNLDTDWAVISRHSQQEPPSLATADNLAYVMYTSGSTGEPKGTCITHRAVVRLTQQQNYCEMSDADVFLQLAPLSFDASTFEIWGSLLNEARLVIYPGQELSFEKLGGLIKQEGVSVMWLTAGLFHMMVEEGAERLKGVKQLLAGGDVLSARHVKKALREMGQGKVINGYGPTENTTFTCCYGMCEEEDVGESVAIGRPISNTRVYIMGSRLEEAPIGVEGELYTGGDGLARGYLNQAEQTAEKFIPDAISGESGARLYRTGDLVRYRQGGEIEFIGRKDQQVKIRGYRIELAEIEKLMSEQAEVKESVVVVREAEATGKQLVAYVVTEREEKVIAAELRKCLSERLPDYMVPSAFVVLDTLPLTPNGKVDRRALPAPEESRSELSPVASSTVLTPVQEVVAGIWSEVLRVDAISGEDNFFELGGHSLVATRVISRLRSALNVEVPLRALFERPALREFSSQVQMLMSKDRGTEGVGLTRAVRRGPAPLSYAQQRLWFLDQLEPGSAFYNVPAGVRLTGELRIAVLEQTLSEIVRRHEVLRTRFEEVEGEQVQVVGQAEAVALKLVDLSGLGEEEREEKAEELAREEGSRGFDLSKGPMLRAVVVRKSEEEHKVLFTMHHIVSDEWSTDLLVKEVREIYEAYSGGERSGLEELEVQYGDYAIWQRERLSGKQKEEEMSYWREQLREAPEVIELATDKPRPGRQSYRGATERMGVSEEVSEGIRKLTRAEDVTLFMAMLGVLKVMLYRYSGQTDLVVGSPVANRGRKEVEGLIGFFVNTLVLRTRLRGTDSFREVIRAVRETALQAYMHQELPFEMLVEEMQPVRSLSHSPLFQVMFVLQQGRDNELELRGTKLESEAGEGNTAKFDLTMFVKDSGEQLITAMEYNTDLYKRETIVGMLKHLGKLMEGIVEDAGRPIRQLEMMSRTEREQILIEWNRTEERNSGVESIQEMFEEQVERTPDRVAVVMEEVEVSYGELNRRANRMAHYLREEGVGPEVRVGLCVRRGIEMVVGLLGILKAGGGYVPMDVGYPAQRLCYMAEDSGAEVVMTEKEMEWKLGEVRGKLICMEEREEEIRKRREENPRSGVRGENVVYVIYTSGSTGKPKGISMPHRALVNLFEWHRRELMEEARTMQYASISFDASIHEMYGGWMSGGTVVIVKEEVRADVERLGEYIVEQGVEKVVLPVVVLQQMAEVYAGKEEELGALKEVITTGEQLQVTRGVKQMFERMSSSELHNHYGPSESHVVTAYQMEGEAEEWAWQPPIGKPISNTQMYILDEEKEAVPVRVVGELWVSGSGLARGYMNRPELTAEKFVPDPFAKEEGGRMYRTGDSSRYLAGGEIEYLGRRDQQVKVRGYRIELGEIEAVLSEHEEVRESVVEVREAEGRGKQLVAYVVSESEGSAKAGELKRYLRERMPDYMVPTAFVMLEELPLTSNGKVDRRALRAIEESRREEPGSGTEGKLTPVEEVVAGIWSEVLRVDAITGEDNFFELGGHSLLATRVISRVRSALNVEAPLRALFETPTLREFSSQVQMLMSKDGATEGVGLTRAERRGPAPLSYAQQRLWFLDQLEPGSAFYNIPAGVRLIGELKVAVLEQTLSEIVRRHEVLRTRFEEVGGEPVQVVGEAEGVKLKLVDLSGLGEAERKEKAKELAREEGSRGFDLSRGPMLRAVVVRESEEEHNVLFTMHHIVSDEWSTEVLVKEVRELYEAYSGGERSGLEELEVQYGDYAIWQRERLSGKQKEEELSYWREQLRGAPEVTELTTDKARPERQSYRGATESIAVSEEVSEGIRKLSRAEDVTLFMVMLGVLKVMLYRYTGQTDLVVGTPVANRGRKEVEGLIGFFVNTLVLRTRLRGTDSFREVIRGVRETALQAYMHQELPFEMLVEEMQPVRSLSHSPLFQMMFVFQSTPLETLGVSGLKLTPVNIEGSTSKFDMTASVSEAGKQMTVTFEYNSDLFYAETIRGMLKHYERLLECILADPDQPISSLRLLTHEETGGISPADFPHSGLSQMDFESLLMEITKTPAQTGD